MGVWRNVSHDGYAVIEYTLLPVGNVVSNYTPSFSVPPGKDFTVICNYDATNTSNSAHVELFYSDTPGGTFRARAKATGTSFIPVTAEIDTATPVLFTDVSTYHSYPCYKLKVCSATLDSNDYIKFVVFWSQNPEAD